GFLPVLAIAGALAALFWLSPYILITDATGASGCRLSSFRPAHSSPLPLGGGPITLTAADFNGDGLDDLAIAIQGTGSVSILLGNGRGGFVRAAHSPISVGNGPLSLTAGNFNGDRHPDLAVTSLASNSVSILLGRGNGEFKPAPHSPIKVGRGPDSIVASDFNADGNLDLAVANSDSNSVDVLLGDGSGSFRRADRASFRVGAAPWSIAVGDFNGDGHHDLAVANHDSSNVSVLYGNGRGGFEAAPGSPFAVGASPGRIAAGDFNSDGRDDLATTNTISNSVSVLLNDGKGGFREAPHSPFAVGRGPYSIAVGDFNSDGYDDLAIADLNIVNGKSEISVLLREDSGGFKPAPRSPFIVPDPSDSITVGDFNHDGGLDVATANFDNNTVSVLLRTCNWPVGG
ncbi:MAG: VCBS repeat-containing protein, partial [Gaiellaceae bacterium]